MSEISTQMLWGQNYNENNKRFPEEFYGLIISTAEQAISEEKSEILNNLEKFINTLKMDNSLKNIIFYHIRKIRHNN